MKLLGIELNNVILNDGQDTVKKFGFFFFFSKLHKWQENINDVP